MSEGSELAARIEALDDFAAIYAAERLAERAATGREAAAPMPSLPEFEGLIEAASRDASAPLGGDGGAIARGLLGAFAADEDFALLVAAAVSGAADTQLATKPILAVGVAASLIIIAASTEIKIKFDNIEIHKVTASPELVASAGGVLRPVALPRDARQYGEGRRDLPPPRP